MNTEQIDTTIAQIDATDVSEECEGKVLLIEGVQATRIEQVRNAALESKAVGVIILDDDPDEVNTLQAAPQEVVGIPVYAVSRSSFGNRDLSGTQVKFKGKPVCFFVQALDKFDGTALAQSSKTCDAGPQKRFNMPSFSRTTQTSESKASGWSPFPMQARPRKNWSCKTRRSECFRHASSTSSGQRR